MASNPIEPTVGGESEIARNSRDDSIKSGPKEGLRLMEAFAGIDYPELRNALVVIAEALANRPTH